jgi:CBS domain-containing protein
MKIVASNEQIMLRETAHSVSLATEAPPTFTIALDQHGIAVMTDLDRVAPFTVAAGTPIDDALLLMRDAGVRSAFVINAGGTVLGLVTAYDILGDKPLRHLQSMGCTLRTCRRDDINVLDVMEPVDHWMVIDLEDLSAYSVGDVVETFRRTRRTHIPVVERTERGTDRLRGLLSSTEVKRATGAVTGGLRIASNFAEVEKAVQHGVAP